MNMPIRDKSPIGPAPRGSARHRLPRLLRLLFGCVVLPGLAGLPHVAEAACWFVNGAATTVTFNTGTITLTPGTQIGSVLWTSNTANPASPPVLECDGNTNGGIVNTIAGPPTGGDNTLFPTGIPGISYRILHPDASSALPAYPNGAIGAGQYLFSVPSNLQLIYTGPFLPPDNSTLNGQLSRWEFDICTPNRRGNGCRRSSTPSPQPVEIFNISANIIIQVPTCDVDPGSVNKAVTLPGITTVQLTGQGSTAGKTPFSLQLTSCPSGQDIFIALDTSAPQAGATGVIAPSGAGYAAGVGVQILQADGTTPVAFGTAINTGTTTAVNFTISLFARYYQTGATVSAGPVRAVATYTVNYQ